MSSTRQKLELIFDEQLDTYPVEQIIEIVQLLSLSDKECEQKFSENKNLKDKYFPENKERVFTMQEPKTEDDESSEEEPIKHNLKSGQFKASSSTYNSYKNKNVEFSMSYHKGIPNPNDGSSCPIDTIKIDCIFDFEKRKDVIDKWTTEISLIIQSNPEEFSRASAVLLLIEHKSAGIIQVFIKRTTWNEDLHGEDLFEQIINALYMMFLGLDYLNNKELEN